jgi:hypothetical protein
MGIEKVYTKAHHARIILNLANGMTTPENFKNTNQGYPEKVIEGVLYTANRVRNGEVVLKILNPGKQDFVCYDCIDATGGKTPCTTHGHSFHPDKEIMNKNGWVVGQEIT